MKLTCTKEELVKGLDMTDNAVSTKPAFPILMNVRLQTTAEGLLMAATDLQLAVLDTIKAEVIQVQGGTTVPAKAFGEFVRLRKDGSKVEMELNDNKLTIKSGRARCTLATLPIDQYPTLGGFNEKESFSVLEKPFLEVLRRTAFSASTEETRHTLNGVHLSIVGKKIKAAATDGRRLAVSSQVLETDVPTLTAIVPSRTVADVLRMMEAFTKEQNKEQDEDQKIKDENQKIQVAVTDKAIAFKRGGLLMLSRLIEGNFPFYEQVIPEKTKITVNASKKALMDLVQCATVGADHQAIVSLSLEPDLIRIRSGNTGRIEIEDELPTKYSGDPFVTSFNGFHFLEVLGVLADDKEVSLQFNDTIAPFVIKTEGDNDSVYVVVPLRR